MGVAVERREAPGPTSLGSRASKRRVWVTRLCRRRAAGRVMVRQGGPLVPWRLPALHSRITRGRKKGKARPRPKEQGRRSYGWSARNT